MLPMPAQHHETGALVLFYRVFMIKNTLNETDRENKKNKKKGRSRGRNRKENGRNILVVPQRWRVPVVW